jgi:D-arabinose 1-dehydrogenase-like Zn-dependent alcohol dehydrogenase
MFTMRAAVYEEFSTPLTIKNVPDPTPEDDGVVLEVKATGISPCPTSRDTNWLGLS